MKILKLTLAFLLFFSGIAEVSANKYADDFTQINTKLDARGSKKASPAKETPFVKASPAKASTPSTLPSPKVQSPNTVAPSQKGNKATESGQR